MAGHAAGARGTVRQLAAQWGNEEFAVSGHFAASADSERVRREVVLAVAEHDNGWWEWEADPPLSADDGLPQGLGEVVAHPVAGMEQLLVGRAFYPGEQKEEARRFLADVQKMQAGFLRRLEQDEFWQSALEQRHPHARLLQTLDPFSIKRLGRRSTSQGRTLTLEQRAHNLRPIPVEGSGGPCCDGRGANIPSPTSDCERPGAVDHSAEQREH